MTKEQIYLDHAATTMMVAPAIEAMSSALSSWANPSSPHLTGRAARALLEDARHRIKSALDWDGELIFTSGASEAIYTALKGKSHIQLSAVEHDAVLSAGKLADKSQIIGVDEQGQVNINTLSPCDMVAVQQVNNETGIIQNTDDIMAWAKENGALFFCDASQGAGKLPLPLAHMIAISGHKLGGPPGIGALLVKNLGRLSPTGGQEQGYRRGTENLPAILGFAAAIEAGFEWTANIAAMRDRLDSAILSHGGQIIGQSGNRLSTISSYRLPGVSSSAQLIHYDMAGIAVSAGSACSSGTLKASHVLTAMGHDMKSAGEVVRVSLGHNSKMSDVDAFINSWIKLSSRHYDKK
ncbi:aminotransferase [Sphingorhabdus lutea]|uniref:Cysteine desulfurase n=1 Tax=Sphingorhabdus lutea TaxID=1913578 RepID=A0A1L3JF08_9SPHN|nr:cysteine desulfurase family protein [Sphingorhabdus lutea]APG63728.1 aminotransferase [Sphingorhabdus lutea]